jgi:hypothetical protein
MLTAMIILCMSTMFRSPLGYIIPRKSNHFRSFSVRNMVNSVGKFSIACPSSLDIENLGEKLSVILNPGDVILLEGIILEGLVVVYV